MKIDVNTDSIFQVLLKDYFRVNLKIEQKRFFAHFCTQWLEILITFVE
jgi:hypothetical protein